MKINKTINSFYKMAKNPIYYGIFLDEKSHNNLINWWLNSINIPLLEQKFAHHITIKFRPNNDDIIKYNEIIGKAFSLNVIGYAANEKAQAVKIDTNIQSDNPIPHITISCAIGTSPVYSNELIKNSQSIDGPVLNGIFDSFPRTL